MDLHDDLLFLHQESTDDLLPDSGVAEYTSVCSVDRLQSLGHAALLLVGGRGDTLEPQASDRALGHARPPPEAPEHQPAAGGSDRPDPAGPGAAGQTAPASDSL